MLLCSHHLTLATLDYLMVAQCASLTHRILVSGWDLMQLPWVKVYAGSGEHTLPLRLSSSPGLVPIPAQTRDTTASRRPRGVRRPSSSAPSRTPPPARGTPGYPKGSTSLPNTLSIFDEKAYYYVMLECVPCVQDGEDGGASSVPHPAR